MFFAQKKVFIGIALFVLAYIAFWVQGSQKVASFTGQVRDTRKPIIKEEQLDNSVEQSPATAAMTPTPPVGNASDELQYRQIPVPQMSIQEFNAPNFIEAMPAHAHAVLLAETKAIQLNFSAELDESSKGIVLVGQKVAASGSILSVNKKSLILLLKAGSFEVRDFPTGIYEVYYDACFVDEVCYKGQYAFFGVK